MNNQSFEFGRRSSFSFWTCLLVTFFVGVCAPRALAFFPMLISTGFLCATYLNHKVVLPIKKSELAFFSAVTILAFASSFWAPDTDFSIERTIKISAIFISGMFLLGMARTVQWPKKFPVLKAFIGVYVAVCLFLIEEQLTSHLVLETLLEKDVPSHKLNRSFVVLSLFFIPLSFLIFKSDFKKPKKLISLTTVFLATVLSLFFSESQTAQLCFLVGCAFLCLFPAKLKSLINILGILVVLVVVLFPFLVKPLQTSIPESVLKDGILREASIIHRFEVWNHAAEQAMKSPVYGQGIEALRFLKSEKFMENQKSDDVLHAHNAALQIWVEFGAIGILLVSFYLLYVFRSIRAEDDPHVRLFYVSVFMVCFCCSMTGYGLWQGWLLGLFLVVAATSLSIGKVSKKET